MKPKKEFSAGSLAAIEGAFEKLPLSIVRIIVKTKGSDPTRRLSFGSGADVSCMRALTSTTRFRCRTGTGSQASDPLFLPILGKSVV